MTFNRKQYQKDWIRKRREDYFNNKTCAKCNSSKYLQLDHIDPSTKIDHRIWSWSEKRRNSELEKCQVLCKECHKEKSKKDISKILKNKENIKLRTISDEQIINVLEYISQGFSQEKACQLVGIKRGSFSYIKSKGYRKHLFSRVA